MKFSKWIAVVAVCALALVATDSGFAKDKKANEYPNATRQEPKLDMSASDQRNLNKAADLVNDNKSAEAQPLVSKVLDEGKASKYAQSFAHELQGQIYYDQDKGDQAIAEYQKAIAADGLPNAQHFSVMYMIAQLQLQGEKYKEALASAEQWEKASGTQTADELALKANAYYRLDQYQQAVDTIKKALAMTTEPKDSWTQILMGSYFALNQYDEAAAVVQQQLAKNPTDKKLINQLATIYIQGNKDQQALDVLAKAKSQGLITTSDDYVKIAKLYASANKPKEAAATLQEGFAKGIVEKSFDNYKLEGDVCTQAEDDACAIAAYTKASPGAKDGNLDYHLGYELFYSDKSKEAVDALTRAISKGGLRQEGEAYLLRGDAEEYIDNHTAALADWHKAASYASTKTMAEQRIKAVKGGHKLSRPAKK